MDGAASFKTANDLIVTTDRWRGLVEAVKGLNAPKSKTKN